jgi:hypothetical protein
MLFTPKPRDNNNKPDRSGSSRGLDTGQFGTFAHLTRPYKDPGRKDLDKADILQKLKRFDTAPIRLLEEAAGHQAQINRLKIKDDIRLELTQAILNQVYPVVAMWYDKFQAEQSSLPESNERRNALEASIKAIDQAASSYKLLFTSIYSTNSGIFARNKEALTRYGRRIIELLRLIQRIKALRYQMMNRSDWQDVNQVFFSMLLHNAVTESGTLLGSVGVRAPHESKSHSKPPQASMQDIYLSIQLFGLLETNSWSTGMLYIPDAYLHALGSDCFKIVADNHKPLPPGYLITYLQNNGPPLFQRRDDMTGPSILFDYSALYNTLVKEHETIAKMKFLGQFDPKKLSKPLQTVSDEDRVPLLESMLMALKHRTRQQKRHKVHTYDALRVYFGRDEVLRLLRDLTSKDLQTIMDSRQFVDKLAQQSSLLAEDDKAHMNTQWAMINFSSGGLLIGTEETAFSAPIKIGQLVAFAPVDAELDRITLGYINRLHRTDDKRVEVAVVRLSTHAESAVIQTQSDIQQKSGHTAILVKNLYNQWQVIVKPNLIIRSGDPLKLVRADGTHLPVRLGDVWLVKKEFAVYELRSPGLQ